MIDFPPKITLYGKRRGGFTDIIKSPISWSLLKKKVTPGCYSLGLECPLKAHILRLLLQSVVLLEGDGSFRTQGLVEESSVTGSMTLKGILGFWNISLPHSLFASWSPLSEQLCSTMHVPQAIMKAQRQGQVTMDWNIWNHEPE